ncbi:probable inactive protein kinase DDB_G0270444 [Maniola hyperantus]|uniref:probable inactive protein kinase DDB_G0270444 n=1 Tax=Aphantopus hyperantus TaxID=2795564 RepID=UPI002127B715
MNYYYVDPASLVNCPLIVVMAQESELPNQGAEDKKNEATELPCGQREGPTGPAKRYKYCIVPGCKSTTVRTPDKLFFSIPTGEPRRRWWGAVGCEPRKWDKPLSLMCNRFCCEDHFDLEKDMENFIQWKLMGRNGAKKLVLKKGVLPHKFACREEENTPPEVKEKRRKKLIEEILEEARQKELKVILDQRKKEQMKTNKWKLPELRPKETPEENPKVKKITEEDTIPKQRKKINLLRRREKISHVTQVNAKDQELETYTFHIKVEVEDDPESNNGDNISKDILSQDANRAGQENNHFLDINIKVEELDEEFEPEVVAVELKENIIEDETNGTLTTETNPVLTEQNTLVINKTHCLINGAFADISNGDKGDFDPVIIGEIIEDKTNNFVITENIGDKEVFERVIMGKRTQEMSGE